MALTHKASESDGLLSGSRWKYMEYNVIDSYLHIEKCTIFYLLQGGFYFGFTMTMMYYMYMYIYTCI